MNPANSMLNAALAASQRGWPVFPLAPGGKAPVVRDWERRATVDRRQIRRWWGHGVRNNVGLATGRSSLVVIDLDGGRGDCPPEQFAGARGGRDVLAMLAAEAGEPMPLATYTVATPNGLHLYFKAPVGTTLRNTAGRLGWRVDSRAEGGYVVAAGSVRAEGCYRLVRPAPVAPLPDWLVTALTPAPPAPPAAPMQLPSDRAAAYITAIVNGECATVAAAEPGSRHATLLKAARTLGRLVGAGELDEARAVAELNSAAAWFVGIKDWSTAEVNRNIIDGITFGKRTPRHISNALSSSTESVLPRPTRSRPPQSGRIAEAGA